VVELFAPPAIAALAAIAGATPVDDYLSRK
jgi:hypothetical protein